jgi:acetyltransferase-like isoleucine patch superfamily enzyme
MENTANSKPAMTPQQEEFTSARNSSRLELYKKLAVGNKNYAFLAYYEIALLLSGNLPGLLGLGARSIFYPHLFKFCGKKVAFGKNLVLRNSSQITLGSNILFDDFAALDVRGDNAGIAIEDFVTVGRFTTLAAKHGHIKLSKGVNIGSYCRIATNSKVEIGESTLVAAYSYIGPGNHTQSNEDAPLITQPMDIKGGVKIGSNAWIGARATILDGVTIGDKAIVGAHSLVKDDVPPGCVVAGSPAKIIK